jgi:hypothetical protein
VWYFGTVLNTVGTVPKYCTFRTVLKYHTVGTIPKFHTVGTIPKYHTVGTIPKYHTVGTIPKYHTVGTIPEYHTVVTISKYHTVGLAWPHHFAKMWAWAHKTSLIPPPYFKVPVPSQESERSCICMLGISILPLSVILEHPSWCNTTNKTLKK